MSMKFEDRENDWLAQEMRREGYVNNRSSLEKDHFKEEMSRDWNAGAISNARQHEIAHRRADASQRRPASQKNPTANIGKLISLIVVITWFIILFIFWMIIWR